MESAPRLVLTGAAGFVGQRLIERLRGRWRIVAIDREPPATATRRAGAEWYALDIADEPALRRAMVSIAERGGATALLHLAAHYDFTGEPHPEYERTNVEGTRLLLDASAGLGLERFLFASSLAACEFPPPGRALDESSPPDGDHVYAASKRAGEELVRAETRFPTAILRFAAMFSDWCEYAPLYEFLRTWLSERWNARALGGRGCSAVPYLHVRDACIALDCALDARRELDPAEVLLLSPNGATTHEELYRATVAYAHQRPRPPLHVPRPIAAIGLRVLDRIGRWRGRRPFERPWMAPMIDRQLVADARRTHTRIGWEPRARLDVVRRLPFLIENRRSEPGTWAARNEAALHLEENPPQVQILRLFEEHEEHLFEALTSALLADPDTFPHYARVQSREHDWNHRQLLRNLAHSVRTRHRGLFRTYCYDLAQRRAEQGFSERELRSVLLTFELVVHDVFGRDPRARGLRPALHDLVIRTIAFGIDGVEDAYEEVGEAATRA